MLRTLGDALLGATRAGRFAALGEVVTDPRAYERERDVDWAEGSTQLVDARVLARVRGVGRVVLPLLRGDRLPPARPGRRVRRALRPRRPARCTSRAARRPRPGCGRCSSPTGCGSSGAATDACAQRGFWAALRRARGQPRAAGPGHLPRAAPGCCCDRRCCARRPRARSGWTARSAPALDRARPRRARRGAPAEWRPSTCCSDGVGGVVVADAEPRLQPGAGPRPAPVAGVHGGVAEPRAGGRGARGRSARGAAPPRRPGCPTTARRPVARVLELAAPLPASRPRQGRWSMPWVPIGHAGVARAPDVVGRRGCPGRSSRPASTKKVARQAALDAGPGRPSSTSEALPSSKLMRTRGSSASDVEDRRGRRPWPIQYGASPGSSSRAGVPMPWKQTLTRVRTATLMASTLGTARDPVRIVCGDIPKCG